jgi:hypothetical protein
VFYTTDSTGTISDVAGSAGVQKVVRIGAPGVLVNNSVILTGASFAVWDDVQGYSSTMNGGGWWHLSNNGTPFSFNTCDTNFPDKNYGPMVFGSTVTHVGTVVGSSVAKLTCGTALTLGTGNLFGLSSAPAGATTVTSFVTVNDGREVTFYGEAGTVTFNDGGNIKTDSTSVAVVVNSLVKFHCIGTTWYQSTALITT